jgi:predicted nucleic acid-binding protein
VVTKAELISLGIQNGWGNNKIKKLDSLLKKLFLININEADKNLIQSYARIDAFSQGKLPYLLNKYTSRNMGKNDLWIAATAYVTQAELITTDQDFDHLDSTWLTIHRFTKN